MNAINAISKGHLVDVTGKSGIIFGAARKIGMQIMYFVNAMQEKNYVFPHLLDGPLKTS